MLVSHRRILIRLHDLDDCAIDHSSTLLRHLLLQLGVLVSLVFSLLLCGTHRH
jgi:hypothetical protein